MTSQASADRIERFHVASTVVRKLAQLRSEVRAGFSKGPPEEPTPRTALAIEDAAGSVYMEGPFVRLGLAELRGKARAALAAVEEDLAGPAGQVLGPETLQRLVSGISAEAETNAELERAALALRIVALELRLASLAEPPAPPAPSAEHLYIVGLRSALSDLAAAHEAVRRAGPEDAANAAAALQHERAAFLAGWDDAQPRAVSRKRPVSEAIGREVRRLCRAVESSVEELAELDQMILLLRCVLLDLCIDERTAGRLRGEGRT
jgi:hypothetical protein